MARLTRKEQQEAQAQARQAEVEAFLAHYPVRFAKLLHEYHTLPGFSVRTSETSINAWQFHCDNGWDWQEFVLPITADAVDQEYQSDFEAAERCVEEHYQTEREIQAHKALFDRAVAKVKTVLSPEELATMTILRLPLPHESRDRENAWS